MNKHFDNSSFKFGYGFFETFRSENYQLIFFEEHMNRLNLSLRIFNFSPLTIENIQKEILKKLKNQKLKSARIRITAYLNDLNKTEIHYEITPFKRTFPEKTKIKLAKAILPHGFQLRKHKTTSYFLNYHEFRLAKDLGYDEAIFIDDKNHLLEGTRTNIFFIIYKNKNENFKVITSPISCGILPGIGRKKVIKLLKDQGHDVEEKPFHIKNLVDVKEIFIVNSLNGVIPIYSFENLKFNPYHSLQIRRDFENNFYKVY